MANFIDLVSVINQNLEELKLADNDVVDLSYKTIYYADLKKSLLEDAEFADDKDDSLGPADVWNILMERGVVGPLAQKSVRFLSFYNTCMDDKTFAEVTDLLLDKDKSINFVEENGILDLSFNSISPSSTHQIIRWIDEKQIRFINLYGNPECSMRHVVDLCKSMKLANNLSMENIRRLMAHIIFLPNFYIYQAIHGAKMYNQMCALGYLPESWANIHIQYYRSLSNGTIPDCTLEGDPDKDLSFDEGDISALA